MSGLGDWEKSNEAYLATALAWLRLRLSRLAGATAPVPFVAPPEPSEPPAAPKSGIWGLFGSRTEAKPAEKPPLLLPPPGDVPSEQAVADAAAAMATAAAVDPPPALPLLASRLGLSRFETEILLLCAAAELDPRMGWLCARAQGDAHRGYPSFALALALFDDPVWEALSPERPLRHLHLVEVDRAGAQPLTQAALRADERIVNYTKGMNHLDERLAALLTPIPWEREALPASQQSVAAAIASLLEKESGAVPLIHLQGTDTVSKRLIASHVCAGIRHHLYALPSELIPNTWADAALLARLWLRENALLPVALYIDASEATRETADTLRRFLDTVQGLVFADSTAALPVSGRDIAGFHVAKPSHSEQQDLWSRALGADAGAAPAILAGQFDLSLGEIRAAARMTSGSPTRVERVWSQCLQLTAKPMDALAQKLECKATWEDFVLSDSELRMLRHIAAQVRHRSLVYEGWGFGQRMNRGLGISALFAGDSGTGKTMAAEVIANELRLHLFRIDLSAVVNKYIGETEKNLRRVFDAAEDGGAILLFDEADALFGKRSEVKDSHDRYANIEINYLLQRMEAYRGLAILATNMKSALDQAFMRRLRFVVNFPFPAAGERKRIWQRAFPAGAPMETLDFDWLARLNLAGGAIHNAALGAAFLAAERKSAISMPLVLDAARAEFRKLDKPVQEADFRWTPRAAEVAA